MTSLEFSQAAELRDPRARRDLQASQMTEPSTKLLAMVVVDGPPPPCERTERLKMRRKAKPEPRRFPISFDHGEHHRKTTQLAEAWRRKQNAKATRFELDDTRIDRLPVELWTVTDVLMWLDRMGLGKLKRSFDKNEVDGPALLELGPREMNNLGIKALAHRKRLAGLIVELSAREVADGHGREEGRLKHWSALKPVSENQVSSLDDNNGEFDEAGARADFQQAVMEWRSKHGRAQVEPSQSGLSTKRTSLLASFQFDGENAQAASGWKNPFA